jgi:hypothetical protein
VKDAYVTRRSLVWLPAAVAGIVLVAGSPARAADIVYEYKVEHPRYGNIGTYMNVIKSSGDATEVDTELHIAVKLLGITVHREDATRTEKWQGNRLVRFDGVTVTNGTRVEVHGEARDDSFLVTTPTGTITAPAQVHPSNPWSAMVLDTDVMLGAKTGHVETVTVSGGRVEPVTFDGVDLRLKRYDIVGSKHDSVWIDDRGLPVAFRTEEDGSQIDFVLTRPPLSEAANRASN